MKKALVILFDKVEEVEAIAPSTFSDAPAST